MEFLSNERVGSVNLYLSVQLNRCIVLPMHQLLARQENQDLGYLAQDL